MTNPYECRRIAQKVKHIKPVGNIGYFRTGDVRPSRGDREGSGAAYTFRFCFDQEVYEVMVEEKLTAELVKKTARELGADLVGIGGIKRWERVPDRENPISIMPRAKSVIGIAFRMQRGALRGVEEGTYYSAYSLNNFFDINRAIAPIVTRRLTALLEDYGYETCPVSYYSNNLGRNTGKRRQREDGTWKPAPDIFFDFRIAGVLCGMGEIGHSRMLLTPEFGPAERVFFLITEAELEEDPIITGICDRCMLCVKNCPANAITREENGSLDLGVAQIRRSGIDDLKCRTCHVAGAYTPFSSDEDNAYADNINRGTDTKTADGKDRPTVEEMKQEMFRGNAYAAVMEEMFGAPAGLCGTGCVRACLRHLDSKGALTRKFNHRF